MENTTNINTMSFETALSLAKIGRKITRQQFRDTCYITAQYPGINSKNTLPYLQMHKRVAAKIQQPITDKPNETLYQMEVFPVNLSCESIFAEDWYVI